MEDLAKNIQQRYIDEITSKYPIHRFLCLYLYLLAFYIYYTKHDSRLFFSVQEIKIKFLFDFGGGLLSQASIFQLLIAVIMTFITARVSLLIKNHAFKIMSSLSDFDGYVLRLKEKVSSARPENNAIAYSLTSDVSKQLDIKRAMLRGKQAVSEIVITLIICLLIGIKNMIYVDWLLMFGGVAIVIFAQWEAFKVYIAEFLPYFVAEQLLLGEEITFSKDNSGPHA